MKRLLIIFALIICALQLPAQEAIFSFSKEKLEIELKCGTTSLRDTFSYSDNNFFYVPNSLLNLTFAVTGNEQDPSSNGQPKPSHKVVKEGERIAILDYPFNESPGTKQDYESRNWKICSDDTLDVIRDKNTCRIKILKKISEQDVLDQIKIKADTLLRLKTKDTLIYNVSIESPDYPLTGFGLQENPVIVANSFHYDVTDSTYSISCKLYSDQELNLTQLILSFSVQNYGYLDTLSMPIGFVVAEEGEYWVIIVFIVVIILLLSCCIVLYLKYRNLRLKLKVSLMSLKALESKLSELMQNGTGKIDNETQELQNNEDLESIKKKLESIIKEGISIFSGGSDRVEPNENIDLSDLKKSIKEEVEILKTAYSDEVAEQLKQIIPEEDSFAGNIASKLQNSIDTEKDSRKNDYSGEVAKQLGVIKEQIVSEKGSFADDVASRLQDSIETETKSLKNAYSKEVTEQLKELKTYIDGQLSSQKEAYSKIIQDKQLSEQLEKKEEECEKLAINQRVFSEKLAIAEYTINYAKSIQKLISAVRGLEEKFFELMNLTVPDKWFILKALAKYIAKISTIDMSEFYSEIRMLALGGFVPKDAATLTEYNDSNPSTQESEMRKYFYDKYLRTYIDASIVLTESFIGMKKLVPELPEHYVSEFRDCSNSILKKYVPELGLTVNTVHLFDKVGSNIDLSVEYVDLKGRFGHDDILEIENCLVYLEGGNRPEIKISVKAQA